MTTNYQLPFLGYPLPGSAPKSQFPSGILNNYPIIPPGQFVGYSEIAAQEATKSNLQLITRGKNMSADSTAFTPEMFMSELNNTDLAKTVINFYPVMVTWTGAKGGTEGQRKLLELLRVFRFIGYNLVPQELLAIGESTTKIVIPEFKERTSRTRPSDDVEIVVTNRIHRGRRVGTNPEINLDSIKTIQGNEIYGMIINQFNQRFFEKLVECAVGTVLDRRSFPFSFGHTPKRFSFDQVYAEIAKYVGIINKGTMINFMATLIKMIELSTNDLGKPMPDHILTSIRAVTMMKTKSIENLSPVTDKAIGNWSDSGLTTGKNVSLPEIHEIPLQGNAKDRKSNILDQCVATFVSGFIDLSTPDPPITYERLYTGYTGGKAVELQISDIIQKMPYAPTAAGYMLFDNDDPNVNTSWIDASALAKAKKETSAWYDEEGVRIFCLGDMKKSVFTDSRLANMISSVRKDIGDEAITQFVGAMGIINKHVLQCRSVPTIHTILQRISAAAIVDNHIIAYAARGAGAFTKPSDLYLEYSSHQVRNVFNTTGGALTDGTAMGASRGAIGGVNQNVYLAEAINGVGMLSYHGLQLKAVINLDNDLSSALYHFSEFCTRLNSLLGNPITKDMDLLQETGQGQLIENVFFSFIYPDLIPVWIAPVAELTGQSAAAVVGNPAHKNLSGLTAAQSNLILQFRTPALIPAFPAGAGADPININTAARIGEVVGAVPANFVGTNAALANAVTLGHLKAFLLCVVGVRLSATVPEIRNAPHTIFHALQNGNPIVPDYTPAMVSGGTLAAWNLFMPQQANAFAAKVVNDIVTALVVSGKVSNRLINQVKPDLTSIANSFVGTTIVEAGAMGEFDTQRATHLSRSGFVLPRTAYNLFDTTGGPLFIRPASHFNLAVPLPEIAPRVNPPPGGAGNPEILNTDYYLGLLTGVAIHRGQTDIEIADAVAVAAPTDIPRPPKSNGSLVNLRHKEFSSDRSSAVNTAVRLALMLVDVRYNFNNLALLVARGIPIPFALQMFHPVCLRGDPMIWVRSNDFVVMSTIDEAYADVSYFEGKMRPVMSGFINTVYRDDVYSYVMDLAIVHDAGYYDRPFPAQPDAFVGTRPPESMGYIAMLTSPDNHTQFTSVVGANLVPNTGSSWEENEKVHYDNVEYVTGFYGFKIEDIPSDATMIAKSFATHPPFDFNSKPGSYNLKLRSNTVKPIVSDYLFGRCPIRSGSLLNFFDGSLSAQNPFQN